MDIVKQILKNNGIELLPDTTQWINRFEIESESSNRVYVVAQRSNLAEWGCSCPAWKTRRTCKHLNSIKPLLSSMPKSA